MIGLPWMRKAPLSFLILGICLASSVAADTIVFEATTDFPDIEAGEVPYYSEAPGRASLAINAANSDYREKFARAVTVYTGDTAYFDIALNALAELDGEAVYRVFVNDVRIGSTTNPQVSVDYTPIRHSFGNVLVPSGATLAVESLANTNGKVPEGDGTAYARGRWTSLEMADAESGADNMDTVDLSASAVLGNSILTTGDTTELTINVSNRPDSAVATTPVLMVTVPAQTLVLTPAAGCIETGGALLCSLPEIPAGGTHELSLSLTALTSATETRVQIAVSADQEDQVLADNTLEMSLRIDAVDGSDEIENTTPVQESTNAIDSSTTDTSVISGTSQRQSGGGSVSWLAIVLLVTLSRRWLVQAGCLWLKCARLRVAVRSTACLELSEPDWATQTSCLSPYPVRVADFFGRVKP